MDHPREPRPTWLVHADELANIVWLLDWEPSANSPERITEVLSCAGWPTRLVGERSETRCPAWAAGLLCELVERQPNLSDIDHVSAADIEDAFTAWWVATTEKSIPFDQYVELLVESDWLAACDLSQAVEPLKEEELATLAALRPKTIEELFDLSARHFDLGHRSTSRIVNGAILETPPRFPPNALEIQWQYLVDTVRWALERQPLTHEQRECTISTEPAIWGDGEAF